MISLFLVVAIYNSDLSRDSDSPQLSPSCESHDTLAALSHACQVVNIMAFYLDIKLPFHLHHWCEQEMKNKTEFFPKMNF